MNPAHINIRNLPLFQPMRNTIQPSQDMTSSAWPVYDAPGVIPGIGIVFAGAQTAVNGALFAYQVSAEVADRQNTKISAQASKNTIGVADRVIGDVSKEMAEKGCK